MKAMSLRMPWIGPTATPRWLSILPGLAALAAGIGLLCSDHPLGQVVAAVLLAGGFFAHFVLLCDSASPLLGHYAGVVCLLPFPAWRELEQDLHDTYHAAEIDSGDAHALVILGRWLRGDVERVWVPFFGVVRYLAVWQRTLTMVLSSERPLSGRAQCLAALLVLAALSAVLMVLCPPTVWAVLLGAAFLYLVLADSWVLSLRGRGVPKVF